MTLMSNISDMMVTEHQMSMFGHVARLSMMTTESILVLILLSERKKLGRLNLTWQMDVHCRRPTECMPAPWPRPKAYKILDRDMEKHLQ